MMFVSCAGDGDENLKDVKVHLDFLNVKSLRINIRDKSVFKINYNRYLQIKCSFVKGLKHTAHITLYP